MRKLIAAMQVSVDGMSEGPERRRHGRREHAD